MQLIYLSPVPWSSFAQRPHKFAEWFHTTTGGKVIWIDPYPTRLPQLADFKSISHPPQPAKAAAALPEWLSVQRVRALPLEPLPVLNWVNRIFWQEQVASLAETAKSTPTLVAVGKPSLLALDLLARLKGTGVQTLYDAMDDFPAFYSGLSQRSMARNERHLAHSVRTLLVSSTHLQQRWADAQVLDLRLVHNGLDPRVLNGVTIPQKQHQNLRIGYIGTIAAWFDWDWVIALAQARPQDEVILIGPVHNMPDAALPANISMQPPCPHAEAMQNMAGFDIGLIPFKKNTLTHSVDPIKYYEYRALDIPVISTAFGEMAFRADAEGVFLSHGHGDIATILSQIEHYQSNPARAQHYMDSNNWHARFDSAHIL